MRYCDIIKNPKATRKELLKAKLYIEKRIRSIKSQLLRNKFTTLVKRERKEQILNYLQSLKV